jgi:hypothetical protein
MLAKSYANNSRRHSEEWDDTVVQVEATMVCTVRDLDYLSNAPVEIIEANMDMVYKILTKARDMVRRVTA